MRKGISPDNYKMSNRNKARAPRKGIHYCKKCDIGGVGAGGKCPTCNAPDFLKCAKR